MMAARACVEARARRLEPWVPPYTRRGFKTPSATLETPRAGEDQKRMRCGAFPAKIHIVARGVTGNEGNER